MRTEIQLFMFAFTCFNTMYSVEAMRSNHGKEFILSFMENVYLYRENKLLITTAKNTPVYVQITSPKWNDPSVQEQFTLTNGQFKEIYIGNSLRMKGTGLSNKGILINASDEVAVYGVNTEPWSTDAFLALPTDVLGTKYYAVTYFPSTYETEFLIAGIEECTIVNIRLSNNKNAKNVIYNGTVYTPGDSIILLINRYDTFQVQSKGDLTGSYVTSNKPIAFFSGNKAASVQRGSLGHLVEQLIPTNAWCNRFVMLSPPETSSGSYFKIIANTNGADITYYCDYEGNTSFNVLPLKNAGDFSQIFVGPEMYCFLESSNPILVVQFVFGFDDAMQYEDPAMIMIPHVEQFATDYTFTTLKRQDGESFRSIFIFTAESDDIQGFRLDGQMIPNMVYHTIPKTNLSAGYFNISDGIHSFRHTSSNVVSGGILYGKHRIESYGFPVEIYVADPDDDEESVSRRSNEDCNIHVGNLFKYGEFKKVKNNFAIKSGAIWQEDGVASHVSCAYLCLRDCKCVGYTYHKETQICGGTGKSTCMSPDNDRNPAQEGQDNWSYTRV